MDDYNDNRWANRRVDEPLGDRACDWPECEGHGEHRAPKDRDNLRDYLWFCLDHVRDYNKSWNYFKGMDTNEYTAMAWSTAKWDRPTWPIGTGNGAASAGNGTMNAANQANHIREAANVFRSAPSPDVDSLEDYIEVSARRRLGPEERDALKVLDLKSTATLQDVKKRFKQLVKRFHPDANGGSNSQTKESEKAQEQLRLVIAAYAHLVKSTHWTNST
jgi:hypothetical protein